MDLAIDPDEDLIEMPATGMYDSTTPDAPGVERLELGRPKPSRFVGDAYPSFGEKILDVPIAQREPEIEPDGVLDDPGRKAMAGVGRARHLVCYPVTVCVAIGLM